MTESMSYYGARKCFADSIARIGEEDAPNYPKDWNLNNGLTALTEAIEVTLGQIKELLGRIVQMLEKRY